MNPFWSLLRRYSERPYEIPLPKKMRALFSEIDTEDKFLVIQQMYTLHKQTGRPRSRIWLSLEDLCDDIVKGYNPDNDFIFIVDRKDRITVTLK